jgi:hypothetical protein
MRYWLGVVSRAHVERGVAGWGISLRPGHLELTPEDFALIAHAMRSSHPHERAKRQLRISAP